MESDNKPVLDLSNVSGNAFAIISTAKKVAKNNDMDWTTISQEATSGDYDHLVQTMMKYFEVEA